MILIRLPTPEKLQKVLLKFQQADWTHALNIPTFLRHPVDIKCIEINWINNLEDHCRNILA